MARGAILVTGGEGLLGRSLAALSTADRPVVALGRHELDILDSEEIAAAIDRFDPRVIVNAAALTDVDACERDPAAAHRANVEGPRLLALACAARAVAFVHVSTDFVFDGIKRSPYTHLDPPNPISEYGKSKLEGERAVTAVLPEALIVRTSWVFGPGGKNFASRLVEYASKSNTLKGITDMRSLPTYAPDLAARILELVERGTPGTYHVVGSGEAASWLEVARFAVATAGLTGVTVEPVTARELGLPAPRPEYSVMKCLLSERLGLPHLRDWHDAMTEFLRGDGVA